MKILTWNIRGIRGIGRRRLPLLLDAIASLSPDIVTLQEVSARFGLWEKVQRGLETRGLPHAVFSARPEPEEKKYGNVIASRFPLALERTEWAPGVKIWRQLLARAVVEVPGHGPVDVLTAHIPNGSGNGWKKIETFEALATYLRSAKDSPRILTGDFNEPDRLTPDGTMLSFGQTLRTPQPTLEGMLTRKGEPGTRRRWDGAVLAVLDREDLRHAHFDRQGRELFCTHVIRGSERCFDHLLVSKHFAVTDAGFQHGWRMKEPIALSDHSAIWARLEPANQPH